MCNKEKFDKKSAQTALNHCKKEHRNEKRIYECNKCGWWHLTSDEEYVEKVYLGEEDLLFKEKWMKLKGGL